MYLLITNVYEITQLIMLNVVLIDKHPIFRKGFSLILSNYASEITIHEFSGFKDYYKARVEKVDVVILGLNGDNDFKEIKSVKHLVKHLAKAKLIICESDEKIDNLTEYLSLGMMGYLKKTYELQELLECLRIVLSGNKYVNSECVLSHFDQTLKKERKLVKEVLTRRQREVADLLVKGFRTSQISDSLQIKSSTVSTIKMQVYKKLNVSNIIELKSLVEGERLSFS